MGRLRVLESWFYWFWRLCIGVSLCMGDRDRVCGFKFVVWVVWGIFE